jgi:hypothetical protein
VLGGLLALLMLAGLVGGVAASLTMGLLRLAGLLAE